MTVILVSREEGTRMTGEKYGEELEIPDVTGKGIGFRDITAACSDVEDFSWTTELNKNISAHHN